MKSKSVASHTRSRWRGGKRSASARCSAATSSTCSCRPRGTPTRPPTCMLIGGQGVFVKEVQQAVLDGRADIAVHSAKDLPAATPDGLVLAAVPERADPRDALVGATLEALPTGALHRHRFGAPPRAARARAARPVVRRAPRQHRDATAQAGFRRASTRSWSRTPRSSGSTSPNTRPTCSNPRSCCRRSRKARSPSSAAPTIGATTAQLRAIDDAVAHRGVARRARVSRRARWRLQPARAARSRSWRVTRSCSTRCSRRSTATSCCARVSPATTPTTSASPRRAI